MSLQRYVGIEAHEADDGDMITYDDHISAMVIESESAHDLGVIYGINHERARIRQAVIGLPYHQFGPDYTEAANTILSIIDGEES